MKKPMNDCACPKPLRDGAHEILCPTNREMEYYHCAKCDKPTWMSAMAFGQCSDCRGVKNPPVVASIYWEDFDAATFDVEYKIPKIGEIISERATFDGKNWTVEQTKFNG